MYSKQRTCIAPCIEAAQHTNSRSSDLQAVDAGITHSKVLSPLPPQTVVIDVLQSVRNPHLRAFLDSVLHEPLIHGLLTLPLVREGHAVQFPIQILRRLATTYSTDYARTSQEKDLLIVAMVLWGVRSLLPLSIYGTTDLQDVFFTLIRTALHQLDDRTCQISMLLRSLIGLGDAAEEDESMTHLQFAMTKRIQGLHVCKAWLLPAMQAAIERRTVRGVLQFAERAAQQ